MATNTKSEKVSVAGDKTMKRHKRRHTANPAIRGLRYCAKGYKAEDKIIRIRRTTTDAIYNMMQHALDEICKKAGRLAQDKSATVKRTCILNEDMVEAATGLVFGDAADIAANACANGHRAVAQWKASHKKDPKTVKTK